MLRAVTFGQCAFETPVSRIAPDSEIHFALLLSIVCGPADGAARDDIVARLWPRAVGDDGRHCLRQGMYRLRQLGVPVQLNAGRILLDWSTCAVDVHDLLLRDPGRAELLRLGTLPFLPGYVPTLGEPFAYWLEELRARVGMRLRRALADEASAARGRGRFHEMGELARALLALDPLNELGTIVLAESLALEGSKVEALRLLEAYEAEVGVVNPHLQLPARVLRRRVAEVLDESLLLRRFEVPFVGREGAFGTLRALWREVRGGQSRAVIVSGEAGIGKSRLAGELLRLAALDGATVASYTTSAGDAFTPLSTLVSVGEQLLTLPGALGCDQEYLAYIRRLGTPETISAWSIAGMAADVLYAQLVQAFAELVSAIAEEAPLIIFLDDAEQLHPTTWRVLVDVWDRVGRRGVLFLLAARRLPGWFGSLGARSCERLTRHLAVAPLSAEESHDFLEAWTGRHQVPLARSGRDTLVVAAHGNPFYLTELAAHVGYGGDPHQTPDGIHELIATQCRVLSAGAQRVLLVIAVLESRATTGRVRQILEQPAAEFMASLEELENAGLVSTSGPALRVRHRMVAEVATTLSVRSVVDFAHGRAGAILEGEADATGSVELLGDCVTHWERAGETRRAFEAAMKLGHRLMGLGMGEEAERAFMRAESVARVSQESMAALEGLLVAYRLSAKWYAIRDAYARLVGLRTAETGEAPVEDDYYLLALEGSIWSDSPSHEMCLALCLATNISINPILRLRAATLCAMYADNCYDEHAIRLAFDSVGDVERHDLTDPSSIVLDLVYHCSIGDHSRVVELANQLAAFSSESSEFWMRIQGMRRAAVGLIRAGRYVQAESILHAVLSQTQKLSLPHQSFATLELLVDACLAQGAHERARSCLQSMQATNVVEDAGYLQLMRDAATVRVAWALQDRSIISHIENGSFLGRQSSIPFLRHQLLTSEAALSSLRGSRRANDDLIAALTEFHLQSRGMGRQDFSSAVLFVLLSDCGKIESARDLARAYCADFRRESSTLPHQLSSYVAYLGSHSNSEPRKLTLSKSRARPKMPES